MHGKLVCFFQIKYSKFSDYFFSAMIELLQLSFLNSTAAFSHGSTVTVTCNPNYGVRGDVSATCTTTGWSKALGQCFPIVRKFHNFLTKNVNRSNEIGTILDRT